MQQTIETTARPYNVKSQYRSGLRARMREHARGTARRLLPLATVDDSDPAAQSFVEGYREADDDSDEPRPDDAAALQAMAREVFAELERIGAKVSAWPDCESGRMRLDDGLTDEAHDPETLLATLRGLPVGAGLAAMWEATALVAVSSLDWRSLAVACEGGELFL